VRLQTKLKTGVATKTLRSNQEYSPKTHMPQNTISRKFLMRSESWVTGGGQKLSTSEKCLNASRYPATVSGPANLFR